MKLQNALFYIGLPLRFAIFLGMAVCIIATALLVPNLIEDLPACWRDIIGRPHGKK